MSVNYRRFTDRQSIYGGDVCGQKRQNDYASRYIWQIAHQKATRYA